MATHRNTLFLIGVVFIVLSSASQADDSSKPEDPKPKSVFGILVMNRGIAKCGPKKCLNTCKCCPNEVEFTSCLKDECNMGKYAPPVGTCLSMCDVQVLSALFTDPNTKKPCPDGSK